MSTSTSTTKPVTTAGAASTTDETPPTDNELYVAAMEAIHEAVAAVQALKDSPTIAENTTAAWAATQALDLATRTGLTLNSAALGIAADAAAGVGTDLLAAKPEAEPADAHAASSVTGGSSATHSVSTSSKPADEHASLSGGSSSVHGSSSSSTVGAGPAAGSRSGSH